MSELDITLFSTTSMLSGTNVQSAGSWQRLVLVHGELWLCVSDAVRLAASHTVAPSSGLSGAGTLHPWLCLSIHRRLVYLVGSALQLYRHRAARHACSDLSHVDFGE